jgi:hypothetical protein
MGLYASWVPGYTALPQYIGPGALAQVNGITWSDIIGLREGQGVRFRLVGGKANWFQFVIPTPVRIHNERPLLQKVFVLYEADAWVQVKGISVWDGPCRLFQNLDLAFTGDHSRALDDGNTFEVNKSVQYRVRVTILAQAPAGSDGTIIFTSSGADFGLMN